MGEKTSLTKASPKTQSLRTTVPKSIVAQFGLTDADQLEWCLVAEAEGKMGIKIIPKKA